MILKVTGALNKPKSTILDLYNPLPTNLTNKINPSKGTVKLPKLKIQKITQQNTQIKLKFKILPKFSKDINDE